MEGWWRGGPPPPPPPRFFPPRFPLSVLPPLSLPSVPSLLPTFHLLISQRSYHLYSFLLLFLSFSLSPSTGQLVLSVCLRMWYMYDSACVSCFSELLEPESTGSLPERMTLFINNCCSTACCKQHGEFCRFSSLRSRRETSTLFLVSRYSSVSQSKSHDSQLAIKPTIEFYK